MSSKRVFLLVGLTALMSFHLISSRSVNADLLSCYSPYPYPYPYCGGPMATTGPAPGGPPVFINGGSAVGGAVGAPAQISRGSALDVNNYFPVTTVGISVDSCSVAFDNNYNPCNVRFSVSPGPWGCALRLGALSTNSANGGSCSGQFTLTASNGMGTSIENFSFTVVPPSPPSISVLLSPIPVALGVTSISPLPIRNTGGIITSCSVVPTQPSQNFCNIGVSAFADPAPLSRGCVVRIVAGSSNYVTQRGGSSCRSAPFNVTASNSSGASTASFSVLVGTP